MKVSQKNRSCLHGFTLIEMAIVMSILALLIGGMMIPLGRRFTEQLNAETQAKLNKAVEAIIGFAILNRRLPCPDIALRTAADRDGREKTSVSTAATTVGMVNGCAIGLSATSPNSPAATTAGVSWGNLPWTSLGLTVSDSADAWNNQLRYAVYMPLVTQTASPFNVGLANLENANLEVYCRNTVVGNSVIPSCPTTNATPLANTIAFIVYSHGANGYGGTAIGNTRATPFPLGYPTDNDQFGNLPEGEINPLQNRFVSRPHTNWDSTLGEFDDLLVWVSRNTLAAKLLAAGVWP